jgi:hypothetical protein
MYQSLGEDPNLAADGNIMPKAAGCLLAALRSERLQQRPKDEEKDQENWGVYR